MVAPHPDVARGDLAMGTYAANLAAVASGERARREVYADAGAVLRRDLLHRRRCASCSRDVFGALGGQAGDRVLQLRTPFGGGKTHTLLALYHLATARDAARDVPELRRRARPRRRARRGALRRVPRPAARPRGRGPARSGPCGASSPTSSAAGRRTTRCSSTARRGAARRRALGAAARRRARR